MQYLYISTLTEPFCAVYDMRTYVHMQHSVVPIPDRVLVSVCKDRAGPAVAQCLWLIQLLCPCCVTVAVRLEVLWQHTMLIGC